MAAKEADPAGAETAAGGKGKGKRKLLLIALPVVLLGAGAGVWFSGILGGGGDAHAEASAHGGETGGQGAGPKAPVFVDLPEIVANLNAPGRRSSYIRLRSKLEVARAADVATVEAAMPRLLDLYTTYLREMRPEELRGSSGTQRLREELIARANLVLAPARVNDILFTELLVQ
jgi:flagellar FliL protein